MATTFQASVLAQLELLRRRWPIALGCGLATVGLGVPFVMGLPNVYRASASLLVQGQLPSSFLAAPLSDGVDMRLEAIKQEVLSRDRLSDLITRLDLHPDLREKVPVSSIVSQVSRDIGIDITSTSQDTHGASTIAFKLSYVGSDPQAVAKVTNALAKFYIDQNQQMRSEQATQQVDFLKSQLAQAKRKLDAQQRRVTDYTSQNVGQLPEQTNSNLAAIQRLNMQLQNNTNDVMRLTDREQALQAQIVDLKAHPAEQESDPQLQLAKLKKDLSTLLLVDTPDHPDVLEKKREISALEAQIAARPAPASSNPGASKLDLLQSNLKQTQDQLAQAKKDGDDLQAQVKGLEASISAAPVRSTELEAVMRDYSNARDDYDSLQKQYNSAQLVASAASDRNDEQFRVLDPALPPTTPAGPNRPFLLVGVSLLAIALAYGTAMVVDRIDTSFHSVDELRAFTHVPVLASIPRIPTPRDTRRHLLVSCAIALVFGGVLTAAGGFAFRLAQHREGITRLLSRLS
jgi:protein tyrosine kinase modulator